MKKTKIVIDSWVNRGFIKEIQNAFKNYALIEKLRREKKIIPMQDVHHTKKGRAVVLGSGSSLDDMIPLLKKWKGAIFCASSQIDTLIYHGIDPDYMVHIEPFTDIEMRATPELSVPKDKRWGKTVLVGHPSMAHDYLKQWSSEAKNPSIIFRLFVVSLDWYTRILYYAYPWIESIVIPFMTVVPAAISVACTMGYDPIYLAGVDQGGVRFVKYYYKNGKWHKDKSTGLRKEDQIKTKAGVIIPCSLLHMKKGPILEIFGDLYQGRVKSIFNLAPSTKSCVTEIPYCNPDRPMNNDDPMYTDKIKDEVLRNTELYLAFADVYLIPGNNGLGKGYTNVRAATMKELATKVDAKNKEIFQSKMYYEKIIKDNKMSLKEMADTGRIPDDGQAEAARNMDVNAITFVDKEKYMKEARRIKKLADEKYKELIPIRNSRWDEFLL